MVVRGAGVVVNTAQFEREVVDKEVKRLADRKMRRGVNTNTDEGESGWSRRLSVEQGLIYRLAEKKMKEGNESVDLDESSGSIKSSVPYGWGEEV